MQAISSYFNPDQHLVFHKDKNGQMMSGGYQINNLLFENKVPLFVKMGGGGSGGGESRVSANIIPEKFSDLFKDLAVPAGLFMMPPLFSARNYSYEESLDDDASKSVKSGDDDGEGHDSDSDSDSDFYDENRSHRDRHHHPHPHPHPHRFAPVDIFDKLLALVAPSDRIKIDKKTRKSRHSDNDKPVQKSVKSTNKTRRSKAS
jgi:hypothetical protein